MNIKELLSVFGETYNHLYDNLPKYEYLERVQAEFSRQFEDCMEENPDFRDAIIEAAEYREDFFTSDRECAAIMLAYLVMDERRREL